MSAPRPARIVCVGSRVTDADALGPRVHDALAARALPPGVELVDGGLRGLDLLPMVERSSRVVFVDAIDAGDALGPSPDPIVIDAAEASRVPASGGHDAGLAYLVRCLPFVCDGPPPPFAIVGASGAADAALVDRVADRAIALVTAGAP